MKTKKAVVGTAKKNKLHNKAYRKAEPLSKTNLKENLGLLLFHLQDSLSQKQRRMGWKLFEVLLAQYVQCVPDKPGLKNSGERGID